MKKLVLFATLVICYSITNAQTYYISTIAGNGNAGYNGDGIQATSAELNNPIHSATDKAGNVYIADGWNHRVRKVDVNGIITTFAGNGTSGYTGDGGQATDAELDWPVALAFDTSGDLYIADGVIRKVDVNGIITTVAGGGSTLGDGGPATDAELGEPRGIAFDKYDNYYIADQTNERIRMVNTGGIINTVAGNGIGGYSGDGGPAIDAEFYDPSQLFVDDSGEIFVTDHDNNVVRKVNTKGIISTFAGNGTAGVSGDGGQATAAELDYPNGVAVDFNGNVFIADNYSERIRRVDLNGIITTIAGTGVAGHNGDGGPATNAELSSAIGINIDASGILYVSENVGGNNDIRKLSPCDFAFTINPATPSPICSGGSITLLGSGGSTYSWSPATGLNSTTGDSVIASPTVTTTYTITASDTGGCVGSNAVIVTIIPPPNKPVITISVTGDTLFSSALNGNQWYRNGAPITGATDSFLVITGLPVDTYKVEVTDVANGCSITSDSLVLSGINQLSVNSNQLSIYPNPTSGEIMITISSSVAEAKNWTLQITDVLGRTLYTMPPLNPLKGTFEIDLSKLPGGIYFITVINKTSRTVVPVVKQN